MDRRKQIDQFFFALQSINRHVRSGTFEYVQPVITRVQWLILRHLHRRGGSTVGQLAQHLAVRPSTMSQMIDRLEKAKLVRRLVDAIDARTRIVKLTEAGVSIIQQTEARWVEALAEPLAKLTAAEEAQLVELMTKLAMNLPQRGGESDG